METEAAEALQKFSEQSGIGLLIEQYSWLFVVGFALLFLKNSIENILAGCAVFFGSKYDENQTCWIQVGGERRPARISKTAITTTTFYVYETDETGAIIGGTLLSVANNELGSLRIERQLDKLDLGTSNKGD
tara:strand:+ start:43 stop:438 length:396 start_codon:yes stop_codon:yes gene_type:complete